MQGRDISESNYRLVQGSERTGALTTGREGGARSQRPPFLLETRPLLVLSPPWLPVCGRSLQSRPIKQIDLLPALQRKGSLKLEANPEVSVDASSLQRLQRVTKVSSSSLETGSVPRYFIRPNSLGFVQTHLPSFNESSFIFSIDRKRNPEPWEMVDPTQPQKVLLKLKGVIDIQLGPSPAK